MNILLFSHKYYILFEIFSCEGVDAVMVFITINGHKERVDNFCGNELPSQLMSNGPSMSVEFRTTESSRNVKGFR